MTLKDRDKIDKAEIAVQKAYGGKGDLIETLTALRKVYAECGLISNRVTIVDSSIKVLNSLKASVFKSDAERQAAREAEEIAAAEAEKEATKERLYQEHMAKERKKAK